MEYMLSNFEIDKPVHLELKDEILFTTFDYNNKLTTLSVQGTAEALPDRYEVKVSLKKNKSRASLISALAHELGHVIQFSEGRYLEPGIDYTYEIEANKIGSPFYFSYLKTYYPKTYYAYFAHRENQC